MPRFKDDGPPKPPEGHYMFTITAEPSFERKTQKMIVVVFKLKAIAEDGATRNITQNLPTWECGDIWRALGFEKDSEGYWDIDPAECVGKKFEAQIKYEPDRKDPKKTWYRIRDVVIPELSDPPPPGMYDTEPKEMQEEIPDEFLNGEPSTSDDEEPPF